MLNLEQPRHATLVITDFAGAADIAGTIRRALQQSASEVRHLDLTRAHHAAGEDLLAALDSLGLSPHCHYISILAILCQHRSFGAVRALQDRLPRGDCARLELPSLEMGFQLSQAQHMLDIVLKSDYHLQDMASNLFFEALASDNNYNVDVTTSEAVLHIIDNKPWFQLAGKLVDGESRILPGGEVAYTGSCIDGALTIDGGLLATPEAPEAAPLARALTALSGEFQHDPVTVKITGGSVLGFESKGNLARRLTHLLSDSGYRRVTEVGISFNTACRELIHTWPASSNEGCPGIHIGLGGDPDPDDSHDRNMLVHIDLITPRGAVNVNQKPFMKLA
ncbi:hypothetical protein [Porticoccus sp.]